MYNLFNLGLMLSNKPAILQAQSVSKTMSHKKTIELVSPGVSPTSLRHEVVGPEVLLRFGMCASLFRVLMRKCFDSQQSIFWQGPAILMLNE